MSRHEIAFVRAVYAAGGRTFRRSDLARLRVAVDGARVRVVHLDGGDWLSVNVALGQAEWSAAAFPHAFDQRVFDTVREFLKAVDR